MYVIAGIGGDVFALFWDARAAKMRCMMGELLLSNAWRVCSELQRWPAHVSAHITLIKKARSWSITGNGRSPSGLTLEAVRKLGIKGTALPPFHTVTVTVPGAAAAWEDAVKQWGTLDLEQVAQLQSVAGKNKSRASLDRLTTILNGR